MDIAHQSTAEAKQYLHAASVLFNLTLMSSEWVPLWGTCMGLQTLSVLAAGTQTCAVHNEWCVETKKCFLQIIYYVYIYRLYSIYILCTSSCNIVHLNVDFSDSSGFLGLLLSDP